MYRRSRWAGFPRLLVATLLAAACSDALSPRQPIPGVPEHSHTGTGGIALDQENGTMAGPGSFAVLPKGFNPTNPHHGSAIVATFLWNGSTSVTRVSDHLTNGTPVGNSYTRVDSVTAGGITMVTYLATNIKGFPDPNLNPDGSCCDPNQVLVVQADLSAPVTEAGIMLTAYAGVDTIFSTALGAHQSASGSASSTATVSPGAMTADSGALVYAAALGTPVVGHDPRSPSAGASASLEADKQWMVTASAGSVSPQWTWFFSTAQPGTWIATGLVLNPLGATSPPPPATATRLAFTTQPSNETAGSPITPAVQVTAQDDAGNPVTSFSGTVSVAIGINPGGGTLSGTTSVAAVNGVATFSNLSINKTGTGYTLMAASSGLTGATSTAFTVTPGPVSAGQSSVAASPSTITAGSGSATITITARDANGNPVSGATVVLSATGSGNTLTQPAGPTDANGVATGSLSSTVAETKTVSATANGVAITQTATVTVTTGTGNLMVTTSTTGSSLDPDGYTVSLDGGPGQAIGINSSFTFTGLSAGSHTVALSGVASNCTVSGGTTRTVNVPSGGTATVSYSVSCVTPNSAPVVNAGPDESALTGLLYTLSWSFTDANHNGPWSYTINWGDGSTSTGSVSSEGSFSAGHTYVVLLPKSFTVTVTVRDAAGASGSDTKVVSVLLL